MEEAHFARFVTCGWNRFVPGGKKAGPNSGPALERKGWGGTQPFFIWCGATSASDGFTGMRIP
jgi:hypothetical protein